MRRARPAAATEVIDHLVSIGLADAGDPLVVTELTGGVSNDVFAVRGVRSDVVVKRALPRLRVATEWTADVSRLQAEGRALRVARSIIPDAAPCVLDDSNGWLVLERAPRTWTDWRDSLFAGRVDPAVAGRLGTLLGEWQRRTAADPAVAVQFADTVAFRQLRVDPFYLTALANHPDLDGPFHVAVDEVLAAGRCLVHGDFTPKNVLTGPSSTNADQHAVWVIDWEVAHFGDPHFDVALMLTHLLLKTIHTPAHAVLLRACASRFLGALTASGGLGVRATSVLLHTGCLLLARVDGKSPATYLTESERTTVRALGRYTLTGGLESVDDLWAALDEGTIA